VALSLSCAGAATPQSAYIVFVLARTNQSLADVPWLNTSLGGSAGRISTLDTNIEQWSFTTPLPNPLNGTWDKSVTYNAGDTVASSKYQLLTPAGVFIAPLTYRSLRNNNAGNLPENFDGWWTCITGPPGASQAIGYQACPFAYVLNGLPGAANIAATTWGGQLWHSLSWNAPFGPPGDVVQMIDIYVKLNYIVGGGAIQATFSRPTQGILTTPNTGSGNILNPGINAQFQCWNTSGLANFPTLKVSNFDTTAVIGGAQPVGSYGAPYLSALVASGGSPPYAYGIVAGQLPPGVTLNGTTGIITGTPTSAGIFNFTAQVTDSTGATAQTTCAGPMNCGGGVGVITQIILSQRLPVIPLPDPRKCKLGGGIGNE
jgi:hypothetical protein